MKKQKAPEKNAKKPVKKNSRVTPKSKSKKTDSETVQERTLSLRELSNLLMISERRIQQLTKDGVFQRTGHGIYYLERSIQSYIKHLKESSSGNASQVNVAEYHIQKTRKIKAEAEIAEMTAAQMGGELVSVADVKHTWANLVSEVCGRIRNVPTRVVPMILGEIDERRMKAKLLEELDEALIAISSGSDV